MLAAKADLGGTHMGTRRAGPSMACQLTWMRAFPEPLASASLAARMRWNAGKWSGLVFLFTPAAIRLWKDVLWKVASWTTPLFGLYFTILQSLLCRRGTVICRPFLNTCQVKHGPASVTRPDFGIALDFAGANGTFVVAIINVFVSPSGNIGRSRFGRLALRLSRVAMGLLRYSL